VVICLERGADCLHMVHLMPLHRRTPSSLASFKSRLVLPFWYQLTQVVPDKRPLSGCISSSSSSSSSSISAERTNRQAVCVEVIASLHPESVLSENEKCSLIFP